MLARILENHISGASILLILGFLAAVFFLRYLLFAGSALAALKLLGKTMFPRRIQPVDVPSAQMWREAAWSLMSSLVFAGVAMGAFTADKAFHIFQLYQDIASHGWAWFWLSIPCALLVHDFYFYWAHRFMHLPGIYERVHKVHHLSTNPSPLSAFAFHPFEAVIEAGGFILIAVLVPMHPLAFLFVSTMMITINVIGHLGYELYPASLLRTSMGRAVNTATSHNQHHRTFRYNYGLYTLIWDRLFGTLHPQYPKIYAAVTRRPVGPFHAAASTEGDSQ